MLFSLHPNTPQCQPFVVLNAEFLHFLERAIDADVFDEGLFTETVGAACFSNPKTKEKFEKLWTELTKLNETDRRTIFNTINSQQNPKSYFEDRTISFPDIPHPEVLKQIGELTKHLFGSTKGLSGIVRACANSGIKTHFNEFRQHNGKVCPVCGTQYLAALREGETPDDQWRSDYDHLLGKADHPIYAVHPQNLLPTCVTCNQKAKGSKELLAKANGNRRLSFYPYSGAGAEQLMQVAATENADQAQIPEIIVEWDSPDQDTTEKLEAWDEVYQIKSRIRAELGSFAMWLSTKLKPSDLGDFRAQISRHAAPSPAEYRNTEWEYWQCKFISWLNSDGSDYVELIWAMIESAKDDENHLAAFGR